MRTLRPVGKLTVVETPVSLAKENFVSVCSTRNNCRISVVLNGRLIGLASVRKSRTYPGYERRLDIAAYTFARDFARRFLRRKERRQASYVLYIKGPKKHAVLGLLDGGMRFSWAMHTFRGPFNGCVSTKVRRTGRRKKKHVRRLPRVPGPCTY